MNFELNSERQTHAEVLEQEVKKIVRLLRAFPAERFEDCDPECLRSARELAGEFVAHVRGELLWLALRERVHHDRHFALHLRAARHVVGGGRERTTVSCEPLDALGFGA